MSKPPLSKPQKARKRAPAKIAPPKPGRVRLRKSSAQGKTETASELAAAALSAIDFAGGGAIAQAISDMNSAAVEHLRERCKELGLQEAHTERLVEHVTGFTACAPFVRASEVTRTLDVLEALGLLNGPINFHYAGPIGLDFAFTPVEFPQPAEAPQPEPPSRFSKWLRDALDIRWGKGL